MQYGLIAEEVDKGYPELVIHDAQGQIQGVRYDELAPILLSQLQQQRGEIDQLKQQQAELKQANDSLQAAIAKLLPVGDRVAIC